MIFCAVVLYLQYFGGFPNHLETALSGSESSPYPLIAWVMGAVDVLLAGNLWLWFFMRRRQLALAADLTVRNQHLAAAHEEKILTQSLLQSVIDTLPMSIWAVDTNGHLILQNRFSISVIGDHRGQRLTDLPLAAQIVQPWQEAVAPGLLGESVIREHWHNLGSGDPRRLQVRIAPVQQNASIIAVVGAHLDITEHFRRDEIHRRTHRMVALGALASGVAHDFNNLLTGMRGYADLITMRSRDEQAHNYASKICATVAQAQALTTRMLAFTRREVLPPDLYDAHAVIAAAVDLFSATKHPDLLVVSTLRAERSQVRGFADELENAILNLCLNARDAMPSGGQMHLTSTVCTVDAATARGLAPYAPTPGEFLHITVRDTGLGMEPEVIAQCLNPLFTTKGDEGSGLGLPNVHACVLDHCGALRIETAPHQGTTVHLWLPLSDPQPLMITTVAKPVLNQENPSPNPHRALDGGPLIDPFAELHARDGATGRRPASIL